VAERRDDVVVSAGIGRRRRQHRRLAAQAGDLRGQPLQILARLIAVGQHVRRLADLHRADLLQPPPDPHPDARGPRRHLVEQHQPRRQRRCVSHATLVA
jgi:hypothetical protein